MRKGDGEERMGEERMREERMGGFVPHYPHICTYWIQLIYVSPLS